MSKLFYLIIGFVCGIALSLFILIDEIFKLTWENIKKLYYLFIK